MHTVLVRAQLNTIDQKYGMCFVCLVKYNRIQYSTSTSTRSHTEIKLTQTHTHPSVKSGNNTNCKHVELSCLYTLAFYIPFVKIPSWNVKWDDYMLQWHIVELFDHCPSPILFGNHYKMGTDDFYVRLRCCALCAIALFGLSLTPYSLFSCLFYTSFGFTHESRKFQMKLSFGYRHIERFWAKQRIFWIYHQISVSSWKYVILWTHDFSMCNLIFFLVFIGFVWVKVKYITDWMDQCF